MGDWYGVTHDPFGEYGPIYQCKSYDNMFCTTASSESVCETSLLANEHMKDMLCEVNGYDENGASKWSEASAYGCQYIDEKVDVWFV